MAGSSLISSKRLLDPVDRASEVLFGLIMVLTFTGSLSAAEAGRAEVRAMLIGALGCNFAWGIIDGILYLMGCWAEEGRKVVAWKKVRTSGSPEEANQIIAEFLGPLASSALKTADLETIRKKLVEVPEPSAAKRLGKEEYLGALGIFLWVFFVTLPVAVPFVFMSDPFLALRISNGIAVIMLFLAGNSLGRHTGHSGWKTGLVMVGVGIVLVALTIALGG